MKKKFFKVYKAPGYPIEPRKQLQRDLDLSLWRVIGVQANRFSLNYNTHNQLIYGKRN